jgi:hypothetical protein
MKLNQILGYPTGEDIELYRAYLSRLRDAPNGTMKTKERNKVKRRWKRLKGEKPEDGKWEPDIVSWGTMPMTNAPRNG